MTLNRNFRDIEQDMLIHGLHMQEYDYIIHNLDKIDSEEFQKKYNYFFRVRRGSEWREAYYKIFQEIYNDNKKH